MPPENIDTMEIIFGLVGGLAIFIYGMNLMGEGLKKVAGDRMRRIIEILTANPVMGILVGALTTALTQSSSATTVMVVGFVSARLMTLPQAIGVIMGANIGTTITAQLIAFKIGNFAYPIAAIGFILFFFFKKKMLKYLGQTVFAFGLLFIGLNTMGSVMKPLAQSPAFSDMILQLSKYPVLGVLAGTFFTVLIQSSSATIGVLQNLASQPAVDGTHALINLRTAMPVLFGNNIGTTITALLASIGAKVNAKRAAFAHSIFNVMGALIFIWFIPLFARFVEFVSPKGSEVDTIARQIANAHTSFNLLNTIIWIPFVWLLAKVATFVIRGKEDEIDKSIAFLNDKMLNNPSIAMNLAIRELSRMAGFAKKMMESAKNAFVNNDLSEAERVYEIEETVDMLQCEIVKYLSKMLSQSTLTDRQSIRLAGLMHVTGDIERIGDYCENIAESAEIKKSENLPFSENAILEMTDAFNQVNNMVDKSISALHDGDISLAKKVISYEDEIDDLEAKLRQKHIERLNSGLCNPYSGITFIETIHNLERIADHCKNIAEAVLDDSNNKNDEPDKEK